VLGWLAFVVVAFAIGSLCIAMLDRVLEGRGGPAPDGAAAGAPAARPPVVLAAWLAVAAVLSLAIPRFAVPGVQTHGPLLPETAGPWKSKPLEPDRMYLGSVHFDRAERRSCVAEQPPTGTSSNGKPVFVEAFVGENWRHNRADSLRSDKNCVPGRGWWLDEQSELPLEVGVVAERTLARSESRRLLSWTYYVGVDSVAIEALRTFFALERSPYRRETYAYAVRLTTEILAGEKDDAFARRRLRALYRTIEPDLKRVTAW
jgi:hypothetical protein